MVKIKKYLKSIEKISSSVWMKIAVMILTLGILIVIGSRFTTYYSAIEKDPLVNYAVFQEKGIKKEYAAVINVGLTINNFWKFDVPNNSFIMDAVVWFSFNPSNVALDVVDKFEIENAEIKQRTGPVLRMVDGNLFVYYYLKIEFKSLLDYRNFPFDDHRIFIIISNKKFSKEYLYITNKESFKKDWAVTYLKDYTFAGYDVRFGHKNVPLHFWDERKEVAYPVTIFALDFQKTGLGDILIIFVPLIFILFLGVTSLILNFVHENSINALASGSLSGLAMYRFVLQGVSPVGAGFTSSDKFYFIVLLMSFLIFIINVGLIIYVKINPVHIKKANAIRNFLFAFIIITIVMCMYLLLPKPV